MYQFIVNQKYRRRDIYKVIGIPEDTKGGNWDTGYNKYKDDYFLFCNIGVAGRTGHIHDDHFVGDDLIWFAKGGTHLNQPQIQELLNPPGYVYIFYREDQTDAFHYAGTGIPKNFQKDSSPFQITWELTFDNYDVPPDFNENKKISEGSKKTITVNVYERSPVARQKCIDAKGLNCFICGFNFKKVYGELGEDFIHVHHLIPLHTLPENYEVDPITDLIPVCPNCHAMLHRKKPTLTINELKQYIK